jgi:hypothetical protein
MFIKILRTFVVCVLLFSTKICMAFFYDIEPKLINSNLRLAGMGNLDLVVEDFNNEINAYDFGQSPAGIIEDDNGASYFYLPGLSGFTVFGDTVYDGKWSGYGFLLKGVYKIQSKFAIGGSYSETIANQKVISLMYPLHETSYNNYYDTLVIGYTIIPRLTVGFRFSYVNYASQEIYPSSYSYYDQKTYAYEPSLLFRSLNKQLSAGLTYRLSKYESYDDRHKIIVPVIYSHGNLDLGIAASYHTFPNEDPEKSIQLRSRYRIPMRNNHLDIGCLFSYATPNVIEGQYFNVMDGWHINWGIGIAFVADNIGLFGVQYREDGITYTGFINWQGDDSYTLRETYFSIGAEFNPLKVMPLRIGYVNKTDMSYVIDLSILTAGIGFILFSERLHIDFAYNYKIFPHNISFLYRPPNKDHIFALSGRMIL